MQGYAYTHLSNNESTKKDHIFRYVHVYGHNLSSQTPDFIVVPCQDPTGKVLLLTHHHLIGIYITHCSTPRAISTGHLGKIRQD